MIGTYQDILSDIVYLILLLESSKKHTFKNVFIHSKWLLLP